MILKVNVWSFTAKEWVPAGTPVTVTKTGKGGAAGNFQVVDAKGRLMAVKGSQVAQV